MIRFSQGLQDVLAAVKWNQKQLAETAGVSATNVSRWLGGRALPDRQTLGKMIDVLPEDVAPQLVAAWLYDSLPANADQLVKIVPRDASSMISAPTAEEWPGGLSRATRKKFIDFSRLATENPDVMEIVNLLHTAAMRRSQPGS